MLSGDEARAALVEQAASQGERAKGVHVRSFFAPKVASDIVMAMNLRGDSWRSIVERFDRLGLLAQERALSALSPHLGKDLARWWNWSAGQPYQRGWQRRAYRSSDRADSLAARWLELRQFLFHAVEYPRPLVWHAEWALHIGEQAPLGSLFASAIAHGDEDIFKVVSASIRGEHHISGPSRHAFEALLSSPNSAGWAEVEGLLVAVQRSEGLRQAILEAADFAHPEAFARILDLIIEHRLARFAGTVRALGVWIGEDLTVRQEKQVTDAVATIRKHLRHPPHPEILVNADPVDAFLGIWALAVRDVQAATAAATSVLSSTDERNRLAAARLLADFAVPGTAAGLARAIADVSVPVYAAAVTAWQPYSYGAVQSPVPMTPAVRAGLQDRVRSLGKSRDVETGLIGIVPRKVGGALAADVLIRHADEEHLDATLISAGSADGRWFAAREYAQDAPANRAALFSLVADQSARVRETVSGALQSVQAITEDEALLLEEALTRKIADLRTTALSLLQKQDPPAFATTVRRLSAGTADQRRAADELAGSDKATHDPEHDLPASIWFKLSDRTPSVRPKAPPASSWKQHHDRCRLAWTSLASWLAEHADGEVQTDQGVELLANIRWIPARHDGQLPLSGILQPWWERIQPQLTDGGLEVALLTQIPPSNSPWVLNATRTVVGPVALQFPKAQDNALLWGALHAVALYAKRDSWAEPLLGMLETAAANLSVEGLDGPAEILERRGRRREHDQWGNVTSFDERASCRTLLGGSPDFINPTTLTDDQLTRLWRALRFIDEPEGAVDRWGGPKVEVTAHDAYGPRGTLLIPDQPNRWSPPTWVLVEAVHRNIATKADLIDALIPAPRVTSYAFFHSPPRQDALQVVTKLRPDSWAADDNIQAIVSEVRAGVVAAEVARGDLPGPLSEASYGLRTTVGATQLVSCLAALGRRPFARAYTRSSSRESTLSHLIRVNQPLPDDTAETFGKLATEAGIATQRLIETAIYAPQWARLIEQHLGWPGLEAAVWWVHAHTKDDSWSVDEEIRGQWATEVGQRTPLDATDLINGAADVAWFRDIVHDLSENRFNEVLNAAKYASSAGGHKRAELFAAALLGRVDEDDLLQRIQAKRHQDSVRALGLLPLPNDQALLRRYEFLRLFVATDKTSGSQRRASESTAVGIGLENLARTAGFRDPQRLVWAMEAEAVRDLKDGPVTASDGDLLVSFTIDSTGLPQLTVQRGGKPLKSVPTKSAKVPQIAKLRERQASLHKQIRRMRSSLEAACILGDAFEPTELAELLTHPILAPMLHVLVLVDAEGFTGFPTNHETIVRPDGTERTPLGALRIAHPIDLLASGDWPDLQHTLMAGGRRQPFKQLFRELYTLNQNERDEAGVSSRRYAGHQIQSRQAKGLFTSRGWVADFEQGFSRTFHQHKITAWCHLTHGWGSPTEVEDATIDDVTFHPAGEWQPLSLMDVPARVFSETMRDLDLVVSVAHAGGIDPETSESTVAMRARLVDETATMLGLANIEVADHHVRVKGSLGTYSIHLGSGSVHRIPGNALCIVPVSAQQRGRIFLPFADDDPRTAEIIAKTILLARDSKIQDPAILQQLVQ